MSSFGAWDKWRNHPALNWRSQGVFRLLPGIVPGTIAFGLYVGFFYKPAGDHHSHQFISSAKEWEYDKARMDYVVKTPSQSQESEE